MTLSNYFDNRSGIDLEVKRTPFSGGSGILPATLLTPRQVFWLGMGSFLLAIPIGVYFTVVRGWLLLPLLLVAAVSVLVYTPFILKTRWPEWAAGLGLEAVIVCPTGVIGPYDFRRSEMGSVILDAALGKTSPYVDGAYDFVDVRDVADGMILAEEKGRAGESYILSGQKMSVRYLLETVREVTGKAFTSIKIPFSLAEFTAKFTPYYYRWTKAKPRFTPYSLEVLRSNADISHAKASRELGYRPRKAYDSIADTVCWF